MKERAAGSSAPRLPFSGVAPTRADVGIVGGGFSGLISLLHIVGRVPGVRVVIVERDPRGAPGIAYGACAPMHLLNVRADRMGALPDDPRAFFAWLEQREPGRYRPADFVPRVLYGEYLLTTIHDALRPFPFQVDFVRDSVDRIGVAADGVRLVLRSGRSIATSAAILALGLPAAAPPWARHGEPTFSGRVDDPWAPGALDGVEADDRVMIVGTGLTSLDVLASLEHLGHRGEIVFVSPGGRFPLAHAAESAVPPVEIDVAAMTVGARAALQTIRRLAGARAAAGLPWQDVLDAVRPNTSQIWRNWPAVERARFLSRLRPFWDIHRHRAPQETLFRLAKSMRLGRITKIRGSVERVVGGGYSAKPRLSATIRSGAGQRTEYGAQWICNCVGPTLGVGETDDALIQSLLASGDAATDPESLGLCSDACGRVRRADGTTATRLYLLGALRRGDVWESTAVPELREQAAHVGAAVAQTLMRDRHDPQIEPA
jgi:uncharacterized NAD(P)/FAD-binding protein YdhS